MVCVISKEGYPLMPTTNVVARLLLKQVSTYKIWRQNNNEYYLRKHFWKQKIFWSEGYFACSIGNVSKEVIENYIKRIRLNIGIMFGDEIRDLRFPEIWADDEYIFRSFWIWNSLEHVKKIIK